MIQSSHEILDAALSLGEKDRAFIAHRLIKSLDGVDGVESELSQEEIDRAWVEEIDRRRQDIREGKTQLLDGNEVLARFDEMIRRGGEAR